MRIGNWEIRRISDCKFETLATGSHEWEKHLASLGVAEDNAMWLAVHFILNLSERETIEGARKFSADPNKCMAAVNASDGVDLVRRKLNDARLNALKLNK